MTIANARSSLLPVLSAPRYQPVQTGLTGDMDSAPSVI